MYKDIVQTFIAKKQVTGREAYRMESYLRLFIDNNIIREYVNHTPDGYSLDISEISDHDKNTLAQLLIESDPAIKEFIEDRMDALIQERIPWVHMADNEDRPRPTYCKQTGEPIWS